MTDLPERRDEPEEVPNWPAEVLDEACELLGTSLFMHRNSMMGCEMSPPVKRAKETIYERLMDNPDDMLEAVVMSADGDYTAADHLLKGYIRTYAEAHLTDLVAHFQIDTGEKSE